MYPFIEIFSWFLIYTFWISLTISFFMFLWMLKRLCGRFWINNTFFFNRILWYFISIFFFSRLFYIIGWWDHFKFIKDPLEFFFMNDYNMSLVWAIFGFMLVLLTTVFLHWLKLWKYIDTFVLSFLFASIVWYIWTFLWWQVYWNETTLWVWILYTNSFSPVPYEVPVFPLAIVYALLTFVLFSILYVLAMFINIRWIIWYMGIIMFSSILLIFENISWKYDFFRLQFWINFTQIWAIIFIILWFYWLYTIYKTPKKIME